MSFDHNINNLKYIKYKTKYCRLKDYINFISVKPFYVTHMVWDFNNLLQILKDKIIKKRCQYTNIKI